MSSKLKGQTGKMASKLKGQTGKMSSKLKGQIGKMASKLKRQTGVNTAELKPKGKRDLKTWQTQTLRKSNSYFLSLCLQFEVIN
jgi:hypothetical protein